MKTDVFIDIETIPGQDNFKSYLDDAKENFKAPSSITKAKACVDLGITGDKAKYMSKDQAILLWEEKFAEDKAPEVAELNWRKEALDGSKGELWSIAWSVDGVMRQIDRGPIGELENEADFLGRFYSGLEHDLTNNLSKSVSSAFYIGHNVVFDIKFLLHRSIVLGVKPLGELPFDGYHGRDYYCTSKAWAGIRDRISLDNLCKALGLSGKGDIDGSKVFDALLAGRCEDVANYNIDDVEKVKKAYAKLNFRHVR
jgi:hypothetical protein